MPKRISEQCKMQMQHKGNTRYTIFGEITTEQKLFSYIEKKKKYYGQSSNTKVMFT